MKLDIESNKYVVAVSGGVDSAVCLDLLAKDKALDLVVAHFDHGIRTDSEADRILVEKLAKKYQLEFEYKRENLGSEASEELARNRRYKFLNEIKAQCRAVKIITAHHQDDVLETATINLLRGTGIKGVIAIYNPEYLRPLLGFTKQDILNYARDNNLHYSEDSTNSSTKYLRNRVRKKLTDISYEDRKKLLELVRCLQQNYDSSQEILSNIWQDCELEVNTINRNKFVSLPHKVACELVVFWLRKQQIKFDRKLIEKLVVDLKVGKNSSFFDVDKSARFLVTKHKISLLTDYNV